LSAKFVSLRDVNINPNSVDGYRREKPAAGSLMKFWALSLVVFFAGYAWFYKLRRSFADIA